MTPEEIPDFDSPIYDNIPFEIEFVDGEIKGVTVEEPEKTTSIEVTLHEETKCGHETAVVEYQVYPHAVGTRDDKIVRVYAFAATDDEACKRHIEVLRLRQQADFLDGLNAL